MGGSNNWTNYIKEKQVTFGPVIFILIGHIFPIWLKNFSGGKGYASFLGILLASSYVLFFIIMIIANFCLNTKYFKQILKQLR